ncbi:alpha/beta fold hydrolase [Actinokineospora sp. NPDC004072]
MNGYAPVNGLQMYYEIHGSGDPVVLLHGALSGIETSFGAVLPLLAKTRRVIAVEVQGHGRTADVDRPLSYQQVADDVAALLRHLGVERADVFGYSMGSGIALELALRHPEAVRKLVLASVSLTVAGCHPELFAGMAELTPDMLVGSPFEEEYLRLAPDPQAFPALVEKVKQFDMSWDGWTAEQVAAITAPVFLVIGDSDLVRPEHAVELFRVFGGGVFGDVAGLPAARLAVLPGTTHVGMTQRADWLVPMVEEFLAG